MADVIYVAGARPNFVKVAPLLRSATVAAFRPVLVHTGQHYDFRLSGVFFDQLGIPNPEVHLDVGSSTHGVQTGRVMAAFEEFVLARADRPRGIVVVGDVNSTMAAALVGVKLGIPVAHIEAGLRSFDRAMPEEINRLVTDAVSDLLLVSEPAGLENLGREGVPSERTHFVGNVMIDTLVHQLPAARALGMAIRLGVEPGNYAVVTLHRPSNVDDPSRFAGLVTLLERLARELPVVFPLHPRTAARLRDHGLYERLTSIAGLQAIEPLGYREFLGLVADTRIVVTDSGGVQEETTFLGVPCVTLRTSTERPVTVTQGTNVLVGEDLEEGWKVIEDKIRAQRGLPPTIDGWDGVAAERITRILDAAWR